MKSNQNNLIRWLAAAEKGNKEPKLPSPPKNRMIFCRCLCCGKYIDPQRHKCGKRSPVAYWIGE